MTAGVIRSISAGTLHEYFLPLTQLDGAITILYLSIMPGIVYSIISYYCIKRVKVSIVAIFSYFIPVVSLISAAVILKEKVGIVDISCVVIVIFGMTGSVLASQYKKIKISLEG
jgi:drug/metabolite transporter (DMT)-like permease